MGACCGGMKTSQQHKSLPEKNKAAANEQQQLNNETTSAAKTNVSGDENGLQTAAVSNGDDGQLEVATTVPTVEASPKQNGSEPEAPQTNHIDSDQQPEAGKIEEPDLLVATKSLSVEASRPEDAVPAITVSAEPEVAISAATAELVASEPQSVGDEAAGEEGVETIQLRISEESDLEKPGVEIKTDEIVAVQDEIRVESSTNESSSAEAIVNEQAEPAVTAAELVFEEEVKPSVDEGVEAAIPYQQDSVQPSEQVVDVAPVTSLPEPAVEAVSEDSAAVAFSPEPLEEVRSVDVVESSPLPPTDAVEELSVAAVNEEANLPVEPQPMTEEATTLPAIEESSIASSVPVEVLSEEPSSSADDNVATVSAAVEDELTAVPADTQQTAPDLVQTEFNAQNEVPPQETVEVVTEPESQAENQPSALEEVTEAVQQATPEVQLETSPQTDITSSVPTTAGEEVAELASTEINADSQQTVTEESTASEVPQPETVESTAPAVNVCDDATSVPEPTSSVSETSAAEEADQINQVIAETVEVVTEPESQAENQPPALEEVTEAVQQATPEVQLETSPQTDITSSVPTTAGDEVAEFASEQPAEPAAIEQPTLIQEDLPAVDAEVSVSEPKSDNLLSEVPQAETAEQSVIKEQAAEIDNEQLDVRRLPETSSSEVTETSANFDDYADQSTLPPPPTESEVASMPVETQPPSVEGVQESDDGLPPPPPLEELTLEPANQEPASPILVDDDHRAPAVTDSGLSSTVSPSEGSASSPTGDESFSVSADVSADELVDVTSSSAALDSSAASESQDAPMSVEA